LNTIDPDLAQSMDLPKHSKGVKSVIGGEPAFKVGIKS
jgi:hypothetical protein